MLLNGMVSPPPLIRLGGVVTVSVAAPALLEPGTR